METKCELNSHLSWVHLTWTLCVFRITLEDDSDEDLDVEPAQRRPVLVLSDSLRDGLQRGIGDILPHTVAQSVWVYIPVADMYSYTSSVFQTDLCLP